MSERPRISVLRFRQLSTGRFYVPRDEIDERRDVRERRQPAARALELTARAVRRPRSAPGTPPPPRWWSPRTSSSRSPARPKTSASAARRGEVLAALERALGVPEGGLHPGLARRPLVVHGRGILELPPGRGRAATWRGAPDGRDRILRPVTPDPLLLRRRLPVLVHGVPVVEAAEDEGRARGRMAAVRAAAGAEAAPRGPGRPPPHRLDAATCTGARCGGDRDPPAALPAPLDASDGCLPVGERRGPAPRASSTRSTRRSSARGSTSRPTPRSAAPPTSPGSTRSRRSRRPTTTRTSEHGSAAIRREAEAAGVAGVPTLLTEDGRTHWGMGGVERLLADEPLVPRATG